MKLNSSKYFSAKVDKCFKKYEPQPIFHCLFIADKMERKKSCHGCGGLGHLGGSDCPAAKKPCYFCRHPGHFERYCRNKKRAEVQARPKPRTRHDEPSKSHRDEERHSRSHDNVHSNRKRASTSIAPSVEEKRGRRSVSHRSQIPETATT